MSTRTDFGLRASVATVAAAVIAGALLASPAAAQDARLDPRWQAWVGCWEPVGLDAPVGGVQGEAFVCLLPAPGASAVDVATVVDGRVTTRERIDATGERRPATRDGCTGWESAQWSADGARVYLRSEYECPGGLRLRTDALMAMASTAEWMDVRGASVGSRPGVQVQRYHEVGDGRALPAEVTAALRPRTMAVTAARMAAAAPVGFGAIADAARHLDAGVVEAWLIEREQKFALDGKRLVQLADAGIPERVIDAMVALSYPGTFTIDRSTRVADVRAPDETRPAAGFSSPGAYVTRDPYDYWSYGRGYSPYGLSWYDCGYSSRGCGWYNGGRQTVIVVGDRRNAAGHGRVTKGKGYSRGTATSDGSRARPRSGSSDEAQPSRTGSSGSSSGARSRGGGSGGSSASGRGSGSSGGSRGSSSKGSGGEPRKAKPRSP